MQALLPRFVLICIGLTPLLSLSVRHWSHIWFFVLLMVATVYWITAKPLVTREDFWPCLILASPVLAILISQTIRGDFIAKSYDSPVRLLAALPIYILIRDQLLAKTLTYKNLIRAIVYSSGMALILLPLFIDEARTAFYGNRIATDRADTNTLGSYAGVLLIIASVGLWHALSQKPFRRSAAQWAYLSITLIAVGVGSDVLLATQSRGAWIAAFACVLAVLLALIWMRPRRGFAVLAIITVLLLIAAWLGDTARTIERVTSIPKEVASWVNSEKPTTSGSIRLSMLEASQQLLRERPLAGYGHLGYAQRLTEEPYLQHFDRQTREVLSRTGPHQGLAARALESGMPGLLAGLILFLGPIIYLARTKPIKAIRDQTPQAFITLMGLLFFVQLFVLQFTIEPYALRFLASFNAVMLAVFLAVANATQHGHRSQ